MLLRRKIRRDHVHSRFAVSVVPDQRHLVKVGVAIFDVDADRLGEIGELQIPVVRIVFPCVRVGVGPIRPALQFPRRRHHAGSNTHGQRSGPSQVAQHLPARVGLVEVLQGSQVGEAADVVVQFGLRLGVARRAVGIVRELVVLLRILRPHLLDQSSGDLIHVKRDHEVVARLAIVHRRQIGDRVAVRVEVLDSQFGPVVGVDEAGTVLQDIVESQHQIGRDQPIGRVRGPHGKRLKRDFRKLKDVRREDLIPLRLQPALQADLHTMGQSVRNAFVVVVLRRGSRAGFRIPYLPFSRVPKGVRQPLRQTVDTLDDDRPGMGNLGDGRVGVVRGQVVSHLLRVVLADRLLPRKGIVFARARIPVEAHLVEHVPRLGTKLLEFPGGIETDPGGTLQLGLQPSVVKGHADRRLSLLADGDRVELGLVEQVDGGVGVGDAEVSDRLVDGQVDLASDVSQIGG